MRLNMDSTGPDLEICSDNQWMSLSSTLQISNRENNVIHNLEGRQTENPYDLFLSWEVLESIARYEIVCSSRLITSMLREDGASTSARVAVLPFSDAGGEYRCCVTAFQSATPFNLAELTSSECITVLLDRVIPSAPSPTVTFPSETSSLHLDPVVAYALGALCGILMIAIIFVAMGCFCVVVSKNRHPNIYLKE